MTSIPIGTDLVRACEEMLARLVAFDTTSAKSNLAMIAYMETELAALGFRSRRIPSANGAKANLFATIGPDVAGGTVLSGHTDVVPCEGQRWSTDPFEMTLKGNRFFGRGTSDMKAFIACAMAAAPLFASRALSRPIHFAWSYDEEVGCIGAPAMIREIVRDIPRPAAVIVGEPTLMKIVGGHKGVRLCTVTIRGHAAHSSLTHLGMSANMVAARLMTDLIAIEQDLIRRSQADNGLEPPHSTLTIGLINGGTAVNILAQDCSFTFDLRCTPDQSPDAVMAPFLAAVERHDREIRARFPDCGIDVTISADVPPFAPEPDGAAVTCVRRLTGDNHSLGLVPYGSEAGQFQSAGLSTVICGPGSIEQAHQPDEFIGRDQIAQCAAFMERLAEATA
ncbi:acetylornithine deacetylase [Sphingosinicella microcystinivorans]|uniref:acetylornithine deacetylase n=1 Tax=Sphingosinicella microcystinivorans TaxID=335406 RepID=UPI0022F3F5B3|nr:acetylornithine deacetylase [Sphingosinicella microcystinivorans]WBX84174.1 acetylornithine deacetylase [Sphingosinicella microcystinivorans]